MSKPIFVFRSCVRPVRHSKGRITSLASRTATGADALLSPVSRSYFQFLKIFLKILVYHMKLFLICGRIYLGKYFYSVNSKGGVGDVLCLVKGLKRDTNYILYKKAFCFDFYQFPY